MTDTYHTWLTELNLCLTGIINQNTSVNDLDLPGIRKHFDDGYSPITVARMTIQALREIARGSISEHLKDPKDSAILIDHPTRGKSKLFKE